MMGSEKFEGILVALIEQTRITQQVLENERGNREGGTMKLSTKFQ